MKLSILSAILCGLCIAIPTQVASASERTYSQPQAVFATNANEGGRLIIKRSPSLGANIAVSVTIDGRVAGSLVRARTLSRYLVPGRHVVVASPNLAGWAWRGTIDVRAGESYLFVARYKYDRISLERLNTVAKGT